MKGMRSLSIVTELSRALSRSYGKDSRRVHSAEAAAIRLDRLRGAFVRACSADAADRPVKIVALGDSLTAGYGLARQDAFPAQLERRSRPKGIAVEIENAGVSGDTASGGLSRLDWSVPDGTDAVILELGANDMLRGVDPKVTRSRARDDHRAPEGARHRGAAVRDARRAQYGRRIMCAAFDAIFPELAQQIRAGLSIRSSSTASRRRRNSRCPTGCIRTRPGCHESLQAILPKVEELIARVRAKRGS